MSLHNSTRGRTQYAPESGFAEFSAASDVRDGNQSVIYEYRKPNAGMPAREASGLTGGFVRVADPLGIDGGHPQNSGPLD
jgi:hypothetical protein